MFELGAGKKASDGLGFEEVVGQREFKEALLTVAASDGLSGLLVRGEKGTAKSTTVRALADLLPEQCVVADCVYGCPPADETYQCSGCRERTDHTVETRAVPLVTLPLGATRDRVVGTLSVEQALEGSSEFDPGLLARANRGILYVDEVNLLDDHLVDVLLDVAASGVNRVERDGVSTAHPARFTLVGTMNPEEGDLRPQLRDRFDLQTTVTACEDIDDRVAIIDRALGNEEPESNASGSSDPSQRLHAASELLGNDDVTLPREFAELAAEIPRDAGVDGHRGDIAIARTAMALAALDGRGSVIETDVERAAELALPHRLASRPFEDAASLDDVLDEHFDENESGESEPGEIERSEDEDTGQGDGEGDEQSADDDGTGRSGDGPDSSENGGDESGSASSHEGDDSEISETSESDRRNDPDSPGPGESDPSDESGRGGTAVDGDSIGDGSDSVHVADENGGDESADDEAGPGEPIVPGQTRTGEQVDSPADDSAAGQEAADAVGPTMELDEVRADADGGSRGGTRVSTTASTANEGARVRTRRSDGTTDLDPAASVRAAARRGGTSVTDRDLRASVRSGDSATLVTFVVDASASMRPAMRTAKGVVLNLLEDAYQHRDEVAFVTFAGEDGEVVLPPTDSVSLAGRHLKDLPTGDRTPLPAGLQTATSVVETADPAASVVVVVTDGRANVAEDSPVAETRQAAAGLARVADGVLVVDAGDGGRASLTDVLVETTGADRVPLAALTASGVDAVAGDVPATR